MDKYPKTYYVALELCECERLYIDRISHLGKKMCSACYTGLSIEDIKKLWYTPIPKKEELIINKLIEKC